MGARRGKYGMRIGWEDKRWGGRQEMSRDKMEQGRKVKQRDGMQGAKMQQDGTIGWHEDEKMELKEMRSARN